MAPPLVDSGGSGVSTIAGPSNNASVAQVAAPGRQQNWIVKLWSGRDVGIVYGFVVVVASLWVNLQGGPQTRILVEQVSTNLSNMRTHPISVLVASAFVVSPLAQLLLVPVVVFVFGVAQRWLGRLPLVATWVFGHVGATLFVMSMEITALYRRVARFSIVVKPDVGVSYGLAAVIGLLAAHVPRQWRAWYVLGCFAATGLMLAIWTDFTSLGHLVAITIGLGMAAAVHGAEIAADRAASSDRSEQWSGSPADTT